MGKDQFLCRAGADIVNGAGEKVYLRGVSFGNEVWTTDGIPVTHHDEEDFKRLRGLGMNAVRFYLNYKTFEKEDLPYQYQDQAWDWLDQNVAWAGEHEVYLILNMHLSQGGFQAHGEGHALWNEDSNQDRLSALWKAIAERYKDEPYVAGYGLLNEPVPDRAVEQWRVLAQRLAHDIRTVDKNHLLFVERCINVQSQNHDEENFNFPMVSDDKVVYEFHIYQPYVYTHQLLEWAGGEDGGTYPDDGQYHYLNEAKGYDNSSAIAFKRNKAYLRAVIERYVNWAKSRQVPVYMGEFGTCGPSYRNGKGGLEWMGDILDLAHEHQLHYTYHAYHGYDEDDYGIYHGAESLPDEARANQPLIDLFRNRLVAEN